MSSFQFVVICALIATALGAASKKGTIVKLSQKDKNALVAAHNKVRAAVSPKAAYMLKLVWDEDLAKNAAKWAAQCDDDAPLESSVPELPGVRVVQNTLSWSTNLLKATGVWTGEKKNFRYDKAPDGVACHYAKAVMGTASRMGCATATCPNNEKMHNCNYATDQRSYSYIKPYEKGTKGCDDCPKKCSGKLCDCKGMVCLNGGTLEFNTCTCTCTNIYKGDKCQTLHCKPDEKDFCTFMKKALKGDPCTFSNVPPRCPKMCGIC